MLSAQPDNPKEGDLYPLSGEYYIWQNGAAHAIGDDSGAISALSAVVADKRDIGNFDVYGDPLTNKADITFKNGDTVYVYNYYDDDHTWSAGSSWIGEYVLITYSNGTYYITNYGTDIPFTLTAPDYKTKVTIDGTEYEVYAVTDAIAKVSQIPTIPQSYDKIQDSSNNVINANRTVSYDVVSYHWKLYDGYENEYDFTGTKTNSEWQSGSDKLKLFMPDGSHWTLQR